MATSYTVQAIPTISELGEGPHWDIPRQSLYYVDLMTEKGTILRYDSVADKTFKAEIENSSYVSFIIPVEGTADEFAVSIDGTVAVIRWDGISKSAKIVRHVVDIEPGCRMNDAKADPHGRLFCGVMPQTDFSEKVDNTGKANLYRYANDEEKVLIVDKIDLPNGLTWNESEKKFYYIDSMSYDIKEYDYDGETGNVVLNRVLIDFKVNGEAPKFVGDGMTIDTEGFLYVALYGGSKVLKINPKSGEIELEIKLPVPLIASVAFGGSQLDVLYVTTSAKKLSGFNFGEPVPDAGALFAVTGLGVKGLPMNNVRV